jgi:hypothetical protein
MRLFSTTTVTLPSDRIETFTLEWRGAAGTLSVQQDLKPADRYTVRVEEAGGAITVHLKYPNGATEPWVRCTRDTLVVAGPTARIVVYSGMCNDIHGWDPDDSSKVPVLACKLLDKDSLEPVDYNWKRGSNLVFASDPGIEWVHVEDECLKSDGWREIAADGSLARPH